MYKLRIYLDSDGDFAHDCSNFEDSNEVKYFYNNRLNALHKLKIFYSVLCKSIRNYDEYFIDNVLMINEFKDYLDLLTKKYETFNLEFRLGNPILIIELTKLNFEEVRHGYLVKEGQPQLTLYINKSFKNDFNWECIKSLSNIDEGESNNEII